MALTPHPDFQRIVRSLGTSCSPSPWKGTCFRFAEEKWCSSQALFNGAGAKRVGGRWSPPGIAAAYVSLAASTAVDEWLAQLQRAGIPAQMRLPAVLCAGECELQSVLDLTLPRTLKALGVTAKDLLGARWEDENRKGLESLSQTVGRVASSTGYEALLVPSAVANAANLVFFPGSLQKGSRVLARGLQGGP